MNVGIRYTFPTECYPRYSYLKTWTGRLVPRFKNRIETNKFDECVCNGYADLQDILAMEHCLQKPSVTVFADPQGLVSSLTKSLVQSMEPFRYDHLVSDKLSWTDLINEGSASSDYDSRILVVIVRKVDKDVSEKLSKLSKAQQESTFIYNSTTKTHHVYKPLSDNLPSSDTYPRTLSHDIQSVFELKVVKLLEKIARYMETLVPREGLEPEKSLLDDMTDKLKQLEVCCVKDVLYGKYNVKYFLHEIHGRYGNKTEVPGQKRRKVKKKKQKIENTKSKDRVIEQESANDRLFTRMIEPPVVLKLIKLIGRRMKCQMIDHLSTKYGIRSMVTATILTSDRFFDFDDKYMNWIQKDKIDKLDTVATILSKCETRMSRLIHEIADYVHQKYEQLEVIQRQQFELFGLLRQSNFKVKVRVEPRLNSELQDALLRLPEVTGCGTIYGILTLHTTSDLSPSSKNLVKELLRTYNYHRGYKVHVLSSKHLQAGGVIKVENGSGLKAEVLREDAPRTEDASVQKNEPNKQQFKCGTLGCYVTVKRKSVALNLDTSSNDSNKGDEVEAMDHSASAMSTNKQSDLKQCETSGINTEGLDSEVTEVMHETSDGTDLCCITCRHCVSGCKHEITTDMSKETFAVQTDYFIDSGEKFDIALLKIEKRREYEYVQKLRKRLDDERIVESPWMILQDTERLASRKVYKFGCITRYTCGEVASADYKERHITEANKAQKYEKGSPNCMDPTVNVIIIGSDDANFSEDGDSGSVICDMNINDNSVTAISILHGSLERNKKWVCTYSALLKQTFDELENRFNIEIKSPDFERSDTIDDPFASNKNLLDFPPMPDDEEVATDKASVEESMEWQAEADVEADNRATGQTDATPQTDELHYKQSGLCWTPDDHDMYIQPRHQNMRQCRRLSMGDKQ